MVKRLPLSSRLGESTWGYVFAGPSLLLIGLLALLPILGAIWLSLHQRLPIFSIDEYVGILNYTRLWSDERFWAAMGTTLYFTGLSVALELCLGLILALVLWRLTGGPAGTPRWMQVAIVLPWAVPTVVSAQMWGWLYHPEYGLLNYLLVSTGLISDPIDWLADPAWAIHSAIIMDVWKTAPFAALLLFAGMNAIPSDLYQAARVDGAGVWAQFRLITLPLLLPIIFIVLIFRTMDAVRVFDAVFVLTGGGPGGTTETLSIYAYRMLFQTLQFGYGSTLATAMFLLVAALTALYLLLLRRHISGAVQ
jgi:multiple sugar transport system permease protein